MRVSWGTRPSSLSKRQQAFVASCMHKTLHTKESVLLPPAEAADQILEAAGSYGLAFYKLASEECGMVVDADYVRVFKRT